MSEAIPYSPECFHGVENSIFKERNSGCPTFRTLQPGGILKCRAVSRRRGLKVDMPY